MKRFALLALFVIAACSSGAPKQAGPKASIPEPELSLEQVHGPAQENYAGGRTEIKYELTVSNKADVPMTLRRLTLRSVNPAGGAYSLIGPFDHYFNQTVPPHGEAIVLFWSKAVFYGRSPREAEPVTVQGTAYFETPAGYVNKVFVADLSQYD